MITVDVTGLEREVFGLGGSLHCESQALGGPPTLTTLRQLRIHQAFLSASAIGDGQVLCGNVWDAETKRALIEDSDERILVADSSKFGESAMTRVGPLSAARALVTDSGTTDEDKSAPRLLGSL